MEPAETGGMEKAPGEGAGAAPGAHPAGAPLVLALLGLAVQGVALLFLGMLSAYPYMMGYYYPGMMGGYFPGMMGFGYGSPYYAVWMAVGLLSLALGIAGVAMMRRRGSLRSGSLLVLAAAVLGFPVMMLWIGSLLMLVGAILGLAEVG